MANRTAIEWCDYSWNPVQGCTRVSAGCEHCYAERVAGRFSGPGQPYAGLARRTPAGPRWTGEVRLRHDRLDEPSSWRAPRRVFVNSMGDLFHPAVPGSFINLVWNAMFNVPRHTFLILTKRPGRLREWTRVAAAAKGWPIEEIWPDWIHLGISAEDQPALEARIGDLLATPAAVRFLSLEPLLGPIDTDTRPCPHGCAGRAPDRCGPDAGKPRYCGVDGCDVESPGRIPFALEGIHWVIAGGESGGAPERRLVQRCTCTGYSGWYTPAIAGAVPHPPCGGHHDPDGRVHPGTGWVPKPEALQWIRSLRDQTLSAGVPFFFKQWGGPRPTSGGRLLDGRTWDEFPAVTGSGARKEPRDEPRVPWGVWALGPG